MLLMIVACGSLWYVVWHTAIPIQFAFDRLQEKGEFEVQGLKGSLSSGVEADAIRFRPDKRESTEWSELKNLKLRYRMSWGMWWGQSGFVIDEIGVDGGRLYGRLETSSNAEELDLFGFMKPLQDALDEITSTGDELQEGALQIKRIRFANLTFVDPQTNSEFHIDEIRLDGLMIRHGQIVEFGELVARMDGLDVSTVPSPREGATTGDKRIQGQIQTGFARRVKQEFSFAIDVSTRQRDIRYFADWFDGRVVLDAWQASSSYRMQILDFNANEYFVFGSERILPQNIRVDLTAETRHPNALQSIVADGSFRLGITRFGDFSALDATDRRTGTWFRATANVDGRQVSAAVRVTTTLPLLIVELEHADGWTIEETWARVVYGKSHDQLTDDERGALRASFPASKPAVQGDTDREMPEREDLDE